MKQESSGFKRDEHQHNTRLHIDQVQDLSVALSLDPLLSLRALTSYCSLSRRTLQNYLRHPFRPLPHFHIGGKILVRRSEFDAWLEQYRAGSTSEIDKIVDSVLQGDHHTSHPSSHDSRNGTAASRGGRHGRDD